MCCVFRSVIFLFYPVVYLSVLLTGIISVSVPVLGDTEGLYSTPLIQDGFRQSPINIISGEVRRPSDEALSISDFNHPISEVINAGHTIRLQVRGNREVRFKGKGFRFQQVHFHTPSEHQVDGVTFPMEMHIVGKEVRETAEDFFVVGVLFRMGKENPFIQEVLRRIPTPSFNISSKETGSFSLKDFFPSKACLDHFYAYEGSLTTPPFTERVHWVVLKEIFTASPEQIRLLNQLEGDNNRHIHHLFNRVIALH